MTTWNLDTRVPLARPPAPARRAAPSLDAQIVQTNMRATDKKLRSLIKDEEDAIRQRKMKLALWKFERACEDVLDALK